MNPLEIWIVDDDPYYGPALKLVIEGEIFGATVRQIRMGEGLKRALETGARPSAVILDMMLPQDEHDPNGGLPPTEGRQATGARLSEDLIRHGVSPQGIAVITALWDDQYLKPLLEIGILKENILIKPALVEDIKRVLRRITRVARQIN